MSRLPPEAVSIEFSVEEGLAHGWDEERIGPLVRGILARELHSDSPRVVSLHLVSDETIRTLNAEHRGKNAPTDVLSFPLDDENQAEFVLPPGETRHEGDVVVSLPRAIEQAAEFGHSVDREIGYLVAHGVLHLLGYDHEASDEQQRMRAKEEEALQPLGFTR